jgi:hypothetical protein
MTQTFTLGTDFNEPHTEKEQPGAFMQAAEPSARTIQTILNFSKNLEVQPSGLIQNIVLVKS